MLVRQSKTATADPIRMRVARAIIEATAFLRHMPPDVITRTPAKRAVGFTLPARRPARPTTIEMCGSSAYAAPVTGVGSDSTSRR
jgi:hypothetical protein